MASQITVFSYQIKAGKKWGYRFETAKINGVRQWATKRGFDTKADAIKFGREAQSSYENHGVLVKNSDMSYSDFLDVWLDSIRGTVKDSTYTNYYKILSLYVKPHIGTYRIRSITKDDIVKLINMLAIRGCKTSNRGLTNNTLTSVRGIISKSFNYAVENKYIVSTPLVGRISLPKYDSVTAEKRITNEKQHVYIPKEIADKIFERFSEGSTAHIPLIFGYRCGLRIGEAFGVCWEDIDFDNKTLTVSRQVQRHYGKSGDGFWYITNPKYESKRTIELDSQTIELLLREKKRQESNQDYCKDAYIKTYADSRGVLSNEMHEDSTEVHFVSVREDGKPIMPSAIQYTSNVIHDVIGFKEFDFHSLRHTHATMLVENGAKPMYVQHRLGHKSINITMRVYFHYTDNIGYEGAKVLEETFGDKSSTSQTNVEETLNIAITSAQ